MILEEETFKAFGYYPDELKLQSARKILVACDDCGEVRENRKNQYRPLCRQCSHKGKQPRLGKHHSEETKRKISESERGKVISEETRRKISEATKGLEVREETKRKISASGKGRQVSEETRRNISESLKGENHPFYGKHLSEEHRRNLSKSSKSRKGWKLSEQGRRNIIEAHIGVEVTEETRKKLREARKRRKNFPKHHTKPEMIYEEICKKYNLQYKYTGDGAFWIGKNPAVNPDFVNCNGKKIAVEIFSYWHDPIWRFGKVKYSQTYEGRKEILTQYGWKLVVFWQEDLEREDAEAFVLSTLKREGGM